MKGLRLAGRFFVLLIWSIAAEGLASSGLDASFSDVPDGGLSADDQAVIQNLELLEDADVASDFDLLLELSRDH